MISPKTANVLVLVPVRNASRHLAKFLTSMKKCLSIFRESHFYFIESYSTDNTLEELSNIKLKNQNVRFETLGSSGQDSFLRAQRIAIARNRGVEIAKEYSSFINYVIVADVDGVNSDLTSEALASCWKYSEWSMMSANQGWRYYDIWALRHRIWNPGDCWRSYDELKLELGSKASSDICVKSKMIQIPRNVSPISVESAFGGLAIYSIDSYLTSHYSGLQGSLEICEHVPFNTKLVRDGHKLFINPALINLKASTQLIGTIKANTLRILNI